MKCSVTDCAANVNFSLERDIAHIGGITGLAIVGDTPKPIETVSACYYDRQLFSGDASGGFKTVVSITTLDTRTMTSGESTALPLLPADDSGDYGFTFTDGYYPMAFYKGKPRPRGGELS